MTNFIDYVKLYCRSGKGGAGSSHFHRAKYVPKGGPDGGDGGRGGHVILRGNRNLWTLLHLKYQKHVMAGDGGHGGESRSFGKDGEDKIIEVPCGTVVYDAESGEFLCEVKADRQEVILLRGGRGGKGNWHFRTATNQAPRYAQPGEDRQERSIILQLKVLADVGLVGFPNAGKSTLLSVVSAAKPEIADYPFTTLTPQLGIVRYKDDRSFCMADIPGIIEGAAEGKGLGLRFLRHIERNSVLLFMVPASTYDLEGGIATPEAVLREYDILLGELRKYNPELLGKARVLAVSKCDTVDEAALESLKAWFAAHPLHNPDAAALSLEWRQDDEEDAGAVPVCFFSSLAHMGLEELKEALWKELTKECNQVIEISHSPIDVARVEREEQEADSEEEEQHTRYMNEVDEEWDLDKYKGIGWDA